MRKLLNTLYVTDENIYLTLDGENIVCKADNEVKLRLPFSNLEGIFCFSYLGCSPALMGKCAQYGIPISFISPSGQFLARVQGKSRGNILLRKRQFELFKEPPSVLLQNTVAAKLANTRSVIKRTLKDYPQTDEDGELSGCIKKLTDYIEQVYNEENPTAILGIEGSGAKAYFDIFNRLILKQKEDFCFVMRSKRPPLDRVNAVLSFMYTILTLDYAAALESVGLDSYMGFYHTPRPGRESLACDLVEEARCIAERFVLTAINLKILQADDFETQISGAVFLNKDGKKKILTKWQEKKRSDIMHPYLKQKIQLGLLPYVQSTLLAKYIRGELDEYPCYIVR
ncbi:MAG: type I-C CRISPR-associated endonuclease Cas1c [Clostridiales bacterium]|nr:type I-C CRISPR-associated endonuclease Cas1c [Clostridiales bacterium]